MPIPCSRLILIVLLLSTVLSSCETDIPVIEKINVPALPDPTSVPVRYRTPIPTPTVTEAVPTPTANLDPDYYFGGMMVTMDDVGKTVTMKVAQDFYLSLGEHYTWTIEIDPPGLVSQNVKITPEPGDQGIYIARESGLGVLRATGAPICRTASPPCARPDILFEIFLVVE